MDGAMLAGLLGLVMSLLFLRSVNKFRLQRKLPPGSDWSTPVVGETPGFLKEPFRFLDEKRDRFGGIFRTNIFGQTTIILSTPESARFVLVHAQKSFKHGYRPSIVRITDPGSCFMDSTTNSRVRKLIAAALGPESIHEGIPIYDALARSVIDSWEDGSTLNTVHEMEKITLKCMLHLLWGQQDHQHKYDEILSIHTAMNKGNLAAFPINLPFTAYGKALKASREFQCILSGEIARARAARCSSNDVLNTLVHGQLEDGFTLTDGQISSVITTLIFAGYRSTASILVWIFKFLHDNPQVLADIKVEHEVIKSSKQSDDDPLSWTDIRKMTLTMKVIQETLRLAPIAKFMPRMSLEDVECNGYLIPKGWRAYVSYHFHFDPQMYPNPRKFDPSRFNVPPKPNTYMPFGTGKHICVGYEFSNTVMPLVVHRLISKFSFKRQGADGVLFWPTYLPKDGFPLKIKSQAA